MARRHDALIPLSHDHRSALALAFRLHNPAPPGPVTPTTPANTPTGRAREALDFFRDSLVEHFAIEEELLFPALRCAGPASGADPELLDELVADHRELERARDRIEGAQQDERELGAALTAFADLLESHVRKEERRLFASFPAGLPADTVRVLEAGIHRRRLPDNPTACKR
jgi:iron-sulfur cluster repair protein YtfE (RIC family)